MAQFINFIINRGILLNIGISLGHIGLRLVVIIITDKIFYSVFGKKLFKLRVELPGQGLVGCHDQGWALLLLNNLSHGKGFTGTSYPQEGLFLITFIQTSNQCFYCLGLVPGRFIG